jgi:hypothetical protein
MLLHQLDRMFAELCELGVPEPSSASGPPDKWELVQVAPYFCSDASQFVIEVVEITSFTEAVPL